MLGNKYKYIGYLHQLPYFGWHAVAHLIEALRYKPAGRGFDSRWCHWNFSLTKSFRPYYGPGVASASKRNEYQYQPYQLHVPIALKSGSLNLLEPSGPVQACNEITLPFT